MPGHTEGGRTLTSNTYELLDRHVLPFTHVRSRASDVTISSPFISSHVISDLTYLPPHAFSTF